MMIVFRLKHRFDRSARSTRTGRAVGLMVGVESRVEWTQNVASLGQLCL